ncbi:amidohydrolase family protein [Pseudolabrys taiwanensis]|uniref:amidohydrolase family protein n=1 Tax=Pseudolabrys taiwanensis TaxID=331696 RepID=UPI0013B3C1B4|nr:amidohydrolase family protein [Pseudolabrys taiwanensis]
MQPIKLDIHTHLVPVDAAALAGIDGVSWDAAAGAMTVDGHTLGMKPLYAPDKLIAWLDANAIGAAWISAPPPLYRQHLSESAAAAWCDYVNRGLADIAQRHANRLTALPHLPIEHPALAADIAARAIAAGRHRFSAPSGGPGRMLSDAAYTPLWQALDKANAFVLFHPGENDDARLTPFYLTNLLGNPYETTVAIAHIVFGGIAERYPNIKFCFAHGGGAAAMLAGRFERAFHTDRPGVDKSLEPPRVALQRLWVDCITHERGALHLAASIFGKKHVVFGSDWPFPMGVIEPQAQLAWLEGDERKRVVEDNLTALSA